MTWDYNMHFSKYSNLDWSEAFTYTPKFGHTYLYSVGVFIVFVIVLSCCASALCAYLQASSGECVWMGASRTSIKIKFQVVVSFPSGSHHHTFSLYSVWFVYDDTISNMPKIVNIPIALLKDRRQINQSWFPMILLDIPCARVPIYMKISNAIFACWHSFEWPCHHIICLQGCSC